MIMSGTSRRLPGLPGRLGLFAAAAVLLPIGASWAQKADEKPGEKTVVVSPEKLDVFGEVEVLVDGDLALPKAEQKESHVVLRLQDNPGEGMALAGSFDEVIRKLEALIVDSKKEAASNPAAKAQAGALVKALEAIKSAKSIPVSVSVLRDAKKEAEFQKVFRVVVHKDAEQKPGASSPEKAEQIAKARQEVARLRKELDATLGGLKKAQARLHELGEDPGDSPFVRWQRSISRPVTVHIGKPDKGQVINARDMKPVPRAQEKRSGPVGRMQLEVAKEKPAPSAADDARLKLLEKRLKDLQDEFDRIKKGSGSGGEKK